MHAFDLGGIRINNSLTRDYYFFSAIIAIFKPQKSVSLSYTENFSCCVDYNKFVYVSLFFLTHLLKVELGILQCIGLNCH